MARHRHCTQGHLIHAQDTGPPPQDALRPATRDRRKEN